MNITQSGIIALACLFAGSASFASAAENTTSADQQESNNTTPQIEEMVISAHPLSAEGLAQPASLLSTEKLQRVVASSLGESLVSIPGVHSSSFGQAVGRPVIRGLGGPRVKTLEDRIDSLDVSVTSPDHLTTIEPFTADSIEVLKGPSTLLYGTGAIGGVVDVHTGRIPHQLEKTSLKIDARAADNASRRSTAARLDTSLGNVGFHLDGFHRDADEFDIPGFAESARQRAAEEAEEHEEEEHEEEHEEEEAFGELPGSEFEVKGGAIGASYINDRGFIGIALSRYEADYGLPGGHGHHEEEGEEEHEEEEGEHEEEEGNPILGLEQTKIDLEAGLRDPFTGFNTLNVRVGINDYEHTETEASGEPGTVFETEAVEGRIELVHNEVMGITGSLGLQASQREFSAIGEEAFVRPVDTDTYGIFYVGERNFGSFNLEGGVRLERVTHDPTDNRSRDFNLSAISLGFIRPIGDNWTFTAQLDRSNRAPVAEELYSDGPHLATNSYEIGDANLDEETAFNVAAGIQYQNERFTFAFSAYHTDFSDYIFESATGAELDELPVLQWQQDDATFQGLEVDASVQVASWEGGNMALNASMDLVDVDLSGPTGDDLPRIPPRRWTLGTVVEWHNVIAELAYTNVDDQNDTAINEFATDGYENLRAYLGYRARMGDSEIELFVRAENLTDDEQRYHTSFIKDFAPQPGRTIEAGVVFNL